MESDCDIQHTENHRLTLIESVLKSGAELRDIGAYQGGYLVKSAIELARQRVHTRGGGECDESENQNVLNQTLAGLVSMENRPCISPDVHSRPPFFALIG
jgi:hypothetical protein